GEGAARGLRDAAAAGGRAVAGALAGVAAGEGGAPGGAGAGVLDERGGGEERGGAVRARAEGGEGALMASSRSASLLRILRLARPERGPIALGVLFLAIGSVAGLLFPQVI